MKSIKVKGLFEEIGTLSEDGTLAVENYELVVNGSVLISKDIIEKLKDGKIVCKKTCDRIKIRIGGSEYRTTPSHYILSGLVETAEDTKLSLPLEKWQQPNQIPAVDKKQSWEDILDELKIGWWGI